MISSVEARRRMGRLMASDVIQARIARLPVNPGEFCADVMEASCADETVAGLEASEVFAVCELAAKLGLDLSPGLGNCALTARNGRAAVTIGFAGLYSLLKQIERV